MVLGFGFWVLFWVQESETPPIETTGFLRVSRSLPCTLNGKPAPCFLFARKFGEGAIEALTELKDVIGY